MPLIAVISATAELNGDSSWWTWDLAWMLDRLGERCTLVDLEGPLTQFALARWEEDEWEAGVLPSVERLAEPGLEPVVLERAPRLGFVAAARQGRASVSGTSLVAWAQGRDEVVLVQLRTPWNAESHSRAEQIVAAADLVVVLARGTADSLSSLRRLGHQLGHACRPRLRYSFIQAPSDWAARRRWARQRVGSAFRSAWLGAGPQLIDPTTDAEWCLGVTRVRPRRREVATPTFDLDPAAGHGVSVGGVAAAAGEFRRIVRRTLLALGLLPPDSVVEPEAERPELSRYGAPYSTPLEALVDAEGFRVERERGPSAPLAALIGEQRCVVVSSEAGLGKTFFAKAAEGEWLPLTTLAELRLRLSEAGQVLNIDGVDECAIPDLPRQIDRWLSGLGDALPRLRVFSLPGPTLDALLPVLARHFRGEVHRLRLLPLSRAECVAWVRAAIPDRAERLLREIPRQGLGHLAARPLTLDLLVQLASRGVELGADRRWVYQEGLTALLAHKDGDPQTLLPIAEHLAWVAVVSGVRSFSPEAGDPDGYLRRDGRVSVSVSSVARVFGLGRGALQATLAGPLFVGPSEARSFAHWSYAEFLAAEFAASRKTLERRGLRSILMGDGSVLRGDTTGFAAWLASARADLAQMLVDADPVSLLDAGAAPHSAVTGEWLSALLRAHRAGRVNLTWKRLRGLGGPDVRPVANELLRGPDQELQRVAVQLLANGPEDEVRPALEAIALAQDLPVDVRTRALTHLDALTETSPLRELVDELGLDDTGAFAAAALPLLRRGGLAGLAFLQALPNPPRAGYAFRHFFEEHALALCDEVGPEDLPEALGWAARHPFLGQERGDFGPGPLVEPLLRRAMELAALPKIREAIGQALAALAELSAGFTEDLEVDWAAPDADAVGVAILSAYFQAGGDPMGLPGGVCPSRAAALDALDAAQPDEATAWIALLRLYGWDAETRRRLEPHVALDSSLRASLDARAKAPAPQTRRAPRPAPPSPLQRIAAILEAGLESPRRWRALEYIRWRWDERAGPFLGSCAWRRMDDEQRGAALALADAFVKAGADAALWISLDEILDNREERHLAGGAWTLLADASQLPQAQPVWEAWGPLFLSNATSARVLDAARQRIDVDAYLERAREFGFDGEAFARLERWTPEAEEALIQHFEAAEEGWLLRLLLARGRPEGVWAWAAARLDRAWVAEVAFDVDAGRAWGVALERFLTDDDFARALVEALVQFSAHRWWSGDEETAVALCVRLTELFPAPRETARDQVTTMDRVQFILSRLRKQLVSDGAVEAVRQLVDEAGWSPRWLRQAELARAQRLHIPPSLEDIRRLDPPAHSSRGLQQRVLVALERTQQRLDGDHTIYREFFDVVREGNKILRRTRKHEPEATRLLIHDLLRELPGCHLQPEASAHSGEDQPDALIVGPPSPGMKPPLVKLEVKWADHKELRTAMDEQLGRYLKTDPDACGIYLVLHYAADIPALEDRIGPGLRAAWRAEVTQLQAQAAALHASGLQVELSVLHLRPSS